MVTALCAARPEPREQTGIASQGSQQRESGAVRLVTCRNPLSL